MKNLSLALFVGLFLVGVSSVQAAKPIKTDSSGNELAWEAAAAECTTIQDGTLSYSASHYLAGEPLTTGFDEYGYNYQGHMFKGSYANSYLGGYGYPPYTGDDATYTAENPGVEAYWFWPYRNIDLLMKWNDMWIANTDCDGDGKLDRHFGYSSYIGSGAWETNHMSGEDWTYFTKIVAVPSDATFNSGVWYGADGVEIGPSIWGDFATIQDVQSGVGASYVSPSGPGFGQF